MGLQHEVAWGHSTFGGYFFMNYYLPAMAKKAQASDPRIMKVLPMVGRASMILVLLGIAITTTA